MQTIDDGSGLIDALDWDKSGGLVPLIIQHAHDGRVLMLGYADRTALSRTQTTGQVHFFSRSRHAIWRKGETSGHVLKVVSLAMDCDADAVLCQAIPAGPTCHRGTESCFDGEGRRHPWLNEIEALIARRCAEKPSESYVRNLLASGRQRVAQKVGEEGVETALAAVSGNDEELCEEAADLLFHLLILLRASGRSLGDVIAALERRQG